MSQGRSSSKDETNSKGMEIEKVSSGGKLKEEPHLSGAYIRNLVKQLTSSKTKDSNMSLPKDPTDHCDGVVVDGHHPADTGFPGQNLTTKLEESLSETKQQALTQQTAQPPPPPPQQQQQQHKKQVRRRLHTSRPYQERLLNMAEARREIVTALKFHRAAMKHANEQQQQQKQQQEQREQPAQPQRQPQSESLRPRLDFEPQEGKIKSRRNHRIYPSNNTSSFSNYLDYNFSSYSSNFSSHHHLAAPNPLFWPANSPVPSLPFGGDQNPNFTLPNQALGLNLNFHDFNNIDTSTLYNHNSSFYSPPASASASASASSPSSSSSHSPSISAANDHDPRGSMAGPAAASSTDNFVDSSGGGGLHAAMDDEEMAEIRSLGEQHQMEWNDTMNLVTSAYWLKFLKADQGDHHYENDDDDNNGINGFKYPFDDQVMEFPDWLSSNNESCLHQQHFDDYYCSDEYFQSPALPCMDIGEIEAMDGDWLA